MTAATAGGAGHAHVLAAEDAGTAGVCDIGQAQLMLLDLISHNDIFADLALIVVVTVSRDSCVACTLQI